MYLQADRKAKVQNFNNAGAIGIQHLSSIDLVAKFTPAAGMEVQQLAIALTHCNCSYMSSSQYIDKSFQCSACIVCVHIAIGDCQEGLCLYRFPYQSNSYSCTCNFDM
jgi:hypothetical protein